MPTALAVRLKLPRSETASRSAARIRDLTSSFSLLGRYPSTSLPICFGARVAGTSNSPFPRPIILCFSAQRHCSGSKRDPVYNQHESLRHDDATQGRWGDGDRPKLG